MKAAALLSLVLFAACGGDSGDYLVVTVNARAAVHDVASLKVTLSNAGSERSEDLAVGSQDFPATFSISAPGRTGDLGIRVEALDGSGVLVGRGTGMTTLASDTASVLVDSADFVVNTQYADDQLLSNYSEANGFQLAANADGTWTATHSDSCAQPCNMFGRRFDKDGRPVTSQAAAGVQAFTVSTKLTSFFSTPAVAANATSTVFVWNNDLYPAVATPTGMPGYSIDCRAFDMSGAATSTQVSVTTDFRGFLTSVTPLSNGNYAIVWDGQTLDTDTQQIRSAVVNASCAVQGVARLTNSTVGLVRGSHVASSGTNILYAWRIAGSVYVRSATLANTLAAADSLIVNKTATEQVDHVRVAPLPGGNFAVFVRWSQISGTTGPGRIDMYRTNNVGAVQGPPVTVTTRAGSDFQSTEAFGVAAHADGSLFVVWHACAENGDDSGCGVFGHLVSPAGTPVGSDINLATTTKENQTGPSVVALPGSPVSFATAWTDESKIAPDTAGAAVRARIIYPDSATSQ